MRIAGNKYSTKTKILIASVVAALGVGGIASALLIPSSPFSINKKVVEDRPENSVDYHEPSNDQKEAGEKAKEDFIKQNEEAEETTPPSSDGQPNVDVTISSAGMSDNVFQIRVIIAAMDDQGICRLELKKDNQNTITQEVGTQILGSYSVCKGFDVPVSGVEKGTWLAKVSYKGSAQGSTERSVDIQ
jgi:hypothetical protein